MMIVFLQLLLTTLVACDETSSFLSNVLTKIQRERLGLLDEDLGMYNYDSNGKSDDYIYDPDDVSDATFKDYYLTGKTKYDDVPFKEEQDKSTAGQGTKMKPVHHKEKFSLPSNDLVYIYNDTIYLYKAPNASMPSKQASPLADMINFSNGKPHHGIFPHKLKMVRPASHGQDDMNNIDGTDPDNLINIVITGNENHKETTPSSTPGEDEEDGEEGYYYYYYPLDQIPPELADTVSSMLSNSAKPIKPGMVTKLVKKPGMPVKMMMMKKKPKRPVGPLFKAMAVFVGTAVVFIVSILLLPRVKLVKAKSLSYDFDELDERSGSQYHELWS